MPPPFKNRLEKTLPASEFTWSNRVGVAFASDIGLGVGEIPDALILENHKRGTKMKFDYNGLSNRDGDTTHWGYRSRCGILLTVFNT